jgi:hypothetical protein
VKETLLLLNPEKIFMGRWLNYLIFSEIILNLKNQWGRPKKGCGHSK